MRGEIPKFKDFEIEDNNEQEQEKKMEDPPKGDQSAKEGSGFRKLTREIKHLCVLFSFCSDQYIQSRVFRVSSFL